MKYCYFVLLLFVFASCKTKSKTTAVSRDQLPSQQFTINTSKDTTLLTNNGALLNITAGSIQSENGTAVLEIKEAYSMLQMIQAGLVTESNGQPLSSGGMIYISGVAGQKLTITRAIRVAIPTNSLTNGMQLFKGDTSGGTINWTEPTPLANNSVLDDINKGRILFRQNCASCHAIGKDLVGPDLAHFPKRMPGERYAYLWYHDFARRVLADSTSDISYCDPYFNNLRSRYGMVGPSFPNLKNEDWNSIYRYIQSYSDSLSLPLPSHAWLKDCADSCDLYKRTVQDLQIQKEEVATKKTALLNNNPEMRTEKNVMDTTRGSVTNSNPRISAPVNFDKLVSPNNYQSQYYQFTIESFGWFNVDILLKDVPGLEPSELFVRIRGQYVKRVNIYLIIPSMKVNAEGGPTERSENEYAFADKNGSISLPQGAKAYILALSEEEGSLAFHLETFTTGKQQSFSFELKASTKEEFNKALEIFAQQDLNIKVKDVENAQEIRKADTSLQIINQKLKDAEQLKPKRCNCDCDVVTKADITNSHDDESYAIYPEK